MNKNKLLRSGQVQGDLQLFLCHDVIDHAVVPGSQLQPDQMAQPFALAADVVQPELQPLGLVVGIVQYERVAAGYLVLFQYDLSRKKLSCTLL